MKTFDLFVQDKIDIRPEEVSVEIHPEVELNHKIYADYKTSNDAWAEEAQKWSDFKNGKQWSEDAEKELQERDQAPVTINVIAPAVEQAKAMLTTNKPRFAVAGRDDSDTETANALTNLLTWVWEQSDGNQRLKQSIEEYYVRGRGFLMAYIDPFADNGNGEVKITDEDSYDVLISPYSKDRYARDSEHILIVKELTYGQIQSQNPQFTKQLRAANPEHLDRKTSIYNDSDRTEFSSRSMEENPFLYIDRYSRVKDSDYRAYDTTIGEEYIYTEEEYQNYLQQATIVVQQINQEPQFFSDEPNLKRWFAIYESLGPMVHSQLNPETGQQQLAPGHEDEDEYGIPGSTTRIEPSDVATFIELGVIMVKQVLTDKIKRVVSIGDVLAHQTIMDITDYPVVPIYNNFQRNPYPYSDVYNVMDPQRGINKIQSLIIAHTSNSTNLKVFVPNGSVNKRELEEKWSKAGSAFIEYEPEIGGIVVAQPPPLPNELYAMKNQYIAEIERILGIYALMQGDASDAPNTYKGTIALEEYGQRRIRSKKDDIEGSLNQLGKVVLQMCQKFYTREKIIRILQPNNEPDETVINQLEYDQVGNVLHHLNNITVGKYDVTLVSGSMLPSNRWAQFDYYFQLFQAGAIDQVELLKKSEIVDVPGVLKRFGYISQLEQQIQSLQEEVKKLSGDLQTATRESVHDKKRLEVEKFKQELKSITGDAKKAEQIYEAFKRNEYDMTKREMKLEKKNATS